MTKKIITGYVLFLLIALTLVGTSTALASEVTGTLSSDTSVNSNTSGNISGTVSSASGDGSSSSGGGGSSSGGSRRGGSSNSNSSNAPDGQVLGASTNNTQTPNFPNAGFAPTEANTIASYWSAMIAFFGGILSL